MSRTTDELASKLAVVCGVLWCAVFRRTRYHHFDYKFESFMTGYDNNNNNNNNNNNLICIAPACRMTSEALIPVTVSWSTLEQWFEVMLCISQSSLSCWSANYLCDMTCTSRILSVCSASVSKSSAVQE